MGVSLQTYRMRIGGFQPSVKICTNKTSGPGQVQVNFKHKLLIIVMMLSSALPLLFHFHQASLTIQYRPTEYPTTTACDPSNAPNCTPGFPWNPPSWQDTKCSKPHSLSLLETLTSYSPPPTQLRLYPSYWPPNLSRIFYPSTVSCPFHPSWQRSQPKPWPPSPTPLTLPSPESTLPCTYPPNQSRQSPMSKPLPCLQTFSASFANHLTWQPSPSTSPWQPVTVPSCSLWQPSSSSLQWPVAPVASRCRCFECIGAWGVDPPLQVTHCSCASLLVHKNNASYSNKELIEAEATPIPCPCQAYKCSHRPLPACVPYPCQTYQFSHPSLSSG